MHSHTPPSDHQISKAFENKPALDSKFQALLDTSSAAIVLLTPKWELIDLNEALCLFLGYDRSELLGMSPRDVTHPEDRQISHDLIKRLVEGEAETYRIEKRYIRKDGEVIWGDLSSKAVRDGDGEIEAIVATIVDITSLKKREKELETSEEKFRDFTEASSGWFWELDENFKFTELTAFTENLFADQRPLFIDQHPILIGATRWEFAGVDIDKDTRWQQHVNDHLAHRSYRNFRYTAVDGQGNEHILSVNGKPIFDEDGKFTGYRGTSSDITELVQAQNVNDRFLHALGHIDEGISLWDTEGRLVLLNDNSRELIGSANKEVTPGITYKKWLEILLRNGVVHEAEGRKEAWLAERMAYFQKPTGSFEAIRNGRWHLFRLQTLPDGSKMHTAFDIHEMKTTEEALRDSEERFKNFATSSSDWFWETDSENRVTFISSHFEAVTGTPVDNLLGKPYETLMPPGTDDRTWKTLVKDMADRRVIRNTNVTRPGPDGEMVWISINGIPCYDKSNTFIGYSGTGTDITSEIKASSEIQRVQGLLYNAINVMEDGLVLYDKDDRLVICNQKYKDLFQIDADVVKPGATFEEIMNVSAKRVIESTEDRQVWMAERIRQHLNPSGPFDQKLTKGRWVRVVERKTAEGGIVGLRIDITREKQEEERLRKLSHAVEQSPSMVFITDSEMNIEYINPVFTKLCGYTTEEVIGKNPKILKSPTTPDEVYTDLWETVLSGREWRGELANQHKDGSTFRAYATVSPVKSEDGEITHFVAMHEDITERNILQDKLRHAQKMEAVGQLTGGIAHDFNNLLGVMIGNAELISDLIGDNSTIQHNAKAIIKAVERGASLTQRLLAFSRQQTLLPQPTEINGLVLGLEDLLQRTLGETIELQTFPGPESCNALIDPNQFENALINIAINARDAMPNGGILKIETSNTVLDTTYAEQHEEVKPGEYVKIIISDNGTGMTEDIRQRAFDPFFTTKDVGEGSGLGLSMVYGFIKQSQGEITINSKPGEGTSVELYLPQALSIAIQDNNTGNTHINSKGSERILVVEDDEDVRIISLSILRNQGYEVVEAENGAEAIELLHNSPPFDLLFTDVVLPGGMNGTDIAKEAARLQPGIKTLFTSGYAETSIRNDREIHPGAPLLTKPYLQAELLGQVRALLDNTGI